MKTTTLTLLLALIVSASVAQVKIEL